MRFSVYYLNNNNNKKNKEKMTEVSVHLIDFNLF